MKIKTLILALPMLGASSLAHSANVQERLFTPKVQKLSVHIITV
ncbi:hypothetical protein [Pseudoalteromonas sp. ESRF-bin5]|nr:hypothetical protein [Pseudoalteromonas sp. ESRF-bin5]